jgi:hypothetical protein
MTILSAYHPPPVLQIHARILTLGDWKTEGPVELASPAAWYGTRAGAAAGEDLLRGLYLLVKKFVGYDGISTWRIDDRGRLEVGMLAIVIDWDHPDTLLPPEYLGFPPGTTGLSQLGYSGPSPCSLPYLWHAGQDAAVDHEEERITQETERTTLGYLSPIVSRRYNELTVEYDTVPVDRVVTSHVTTGEWGAFERFVRGVVGPPPRQWFYMPQASAQTVLTAVGEALDVETWGPYQIRDSHLGRPLGRSQRAEDAPERWDVVLEAEDWPGP